MISVIIPAYNAAKTIKKCIESVLNQSYCDLEVIVVDDGSTDATSSVVEEFSKRDSRICLIRHEINKGLFAARITGVKHANGAYVGFVDSDDFISVDYYRLLYNKASSTNSDFVIGDFYLSYADGTMLFYNLDPIRNQNLELAGDAVFKTFMDQQGSFYGWQLVWNKLYRKELWLKNIEILECFSRRHPKLNMLEDVAFTTVMWLTAKKVTNVKNAVYYYSQHENQMTYTEKSHLQDISSLKKLQDVYSVFVFFKELLIQHNAYDLYAESYSAWKHRMGRCYLQKFPPKSIEAQLIVEKLLDNCQEVVPHEVEDFFYSRSTPVSDGWNRYENIKKQIVKPSMKVISFDVFDTCILRPFWNPADLFAYMNEDFLKLTNAKSAVDYASIRIESEKAARKENNDKEEITLEAIYAQMKKKYCIDEFVCNEMMRREIETEIALSYKRETGGELYDLALACGKKVVFVSDMYLSADVISRLLEKNGYSRFEKVYVSSDTGVTKHSGNMYKYLLHEYAVKPSAWVHIGDNYESDYKQASKRGIFAFHMPKAKDLFCNGTDLYSGAFWKECMDNSITNRDMRLAMDGFLGCRTFMAVAANKLFDNPFVSYAAESDFNASPEHIGYFTVGLYLFAVTMWLAEQVEGQDILKVQFLARDGYLVKQAYDYLSGVFSLPESNYLYVSRKALALANINDKIDTLSLIDNFNIFNMNPIKFINLFGFSIQEEKKNEFLTLALDEGYPKDKKFGKREAYEDFIKLFVDNCWDDIDWSGYRKLVSGYLGKQVSSKDVIFDIGYSGRVESVLNNLLGYKINSFYIHSNTDIINRRENLVGFKNLTLYGYKPGITGVIREHVFMKTDPSAIGYTYENNEVVPVFEKEKLDYPTRFITELVQAYALKYVKDVVDLFGKNIGKLYFRYEDIMQPFEYYLHRGKIFDKAIFSSLSFEDDFGMGKRLNALEFWTSEIERINSGITITNNSAVIKGAYEEYIESGMLEKSIFHKAVYWLRKDKAFFIRRLREYVSGNR